MVGIQLTLQSTQAIARVLPFWGAQRLLQHSVDGTVSIGAAVPSGLAYAGALFIAAAFIMHRRAPSVMLPRVG